MKRLIVTVLAGLIFLMQGCAKEESSAQTMPQQVQPQHSSAANTLDDHMPCAKFLTASQASQITGRQYSGPSESYNQGHECGYTQPTDIFSYVILLRITSFYPDGYGYAKDIYIGSNPKPVANVPDSVIREGVQGVVPGATFLYKNLIIELMAGDHIEDLVRAVYDNLKRQ